MKIRLLLILLLNMVVLCSCVDDAYDLSDIDTTARFQVHDFVVPMNIDGVTLKSVLDLKPTSKIKEINGEYALVEEGDFKSDAINVATFSTEVPRISPIEASLNLQIPDFGVKAKGGFNEQWVACYPLSNDVTSFTIESNNVPVQVVGIDKVEADANIGLDIDVYGLDNILKQVRFSGVKIQMIKGLTVSGLSINGESYSSGLYDTKTGILDLSSYQILTHNGHAKLDMHISGIDAGLADMKLKGTNLQFGSAIHLLPGGIVAVLAEDFKALKDIQSLPSVVGYKCEIGVSKINVETFTGTIKYDITGVNIDPVSLKDIPDLLNQPETDIKILNPQIYLELNNPVYEQYKLTASTGFALTALREKESPKKCSLDDGELIVIDAAFNSFVLSPEDPRENSHPDFKGAKHVGFKSLSDVVSGKGLPQTIKVDVVNPQIDEQHVEQFRLGSKINPVKGRYMLYAPLNLKEGSNIVYTDTISGWNDKDVDGITVEGLTINANVSSDVPLELVVKVYPMVIKDGKSVVDYSIEGSALLPASASDYPLEITLNGVIQHIDGILIKADLASKGQGKTLGPDMTLHLDKLRAKVTGYYDREL